MEQIINAVNGVLWDYVLLFLLCGTGIYFTFRLRFVQLTKFKAAFKETFGSLKWKGNQADKDGMSSFQSFTTAVAAQIGTGNLAGAATAIVCGGPGAVFWMWVSAFFGMATIFAEATAAQKYKTYLDGKVTGGPAYYIRAAFKGKKGKVLAAAFSVFTILALGFIGNMVQSNSIAEAFHNAFDISPIIVGLIIAVLALYVFTGGVKRIAGLTEKLVPIMAVFYILGAVIILILNYQHIPDALRQIFVGAFQPSAIGGGVLGITVQKAMRFGIARGLFSNEAGMGSTPHAHAVAKVKHPCDQGLVAMIGVFVDTFIVLTLTALVIITSGITGNDQMTGIVLTQSAFVQTFGPFGNIFIAICLLFFAFSTIIGWYFFGEANVKYLFGEKAVGIYSILVCCCLVVGSALNVTFVWNMSDTFNGFMVLINTTALLVLSGGVAAIYQSYRDKFNS